MSTSKNPNTIERIKGRTPLGSDFYNIEYFNGSKSTEGIQYPTDGSYLNPHSKVKYKFIDIAKWINKYIKKGEILDIGCGPGHLNYWIVRLGIPLKVHGLDISVEIINSAYNLNDKFTIGDIRENPIECNIYSGITAFEVLEHLTPEESQRVLNKIYISLKKGGFIFIRVPNKFTWTKKAFSDKAHVWIPKIKDLEILLINAGFKKNDMEIFTRGFPFSSMINALTSKDLTLPILGKTICCVAQKTK